MKKVYVVLLGLLSGLISMFFFMTLDFYFFLEGPVQLWFKPFNVFIMPIIVSLMIVNLVTSKFSLYERVFSSFLSSLTAYMGSVLVMNIIESIIVYLR